MRHQKFFAALAVLSLTGGLLSGCSSSTPPAETTPAATTAASTTAAPETTAEIAEDAVYTGTAQGNNGEVTVEVTYADGSITAIEVVSHSETAGISDHAISDMPGRIVEAQSLAVDTISGATVTSNAILTAVESALADAGIDVDPFKAAPEKAQLVQGEAEETDVVIVGAGISGIMAAFELQEDYPDIQFIQVEKLDYVTGSVPGSGGAIAGISSQYHERDNVSFTTQDVVDLFTYTSGTEVNEDFVKAVFEKSDVLLERLISYGTPFTTETEATSKYSDAVYAIRTENRGSSFSQFLNTYVEGKYDLRMGTAAEELIVEDGAVKGIIVADNEKRYEIRAKAVLLATGGFGNNPELMEEYLPLFADGFSSANPGATGDGILMTRQFNTKVVGDGSMGSIVAPDGSNLIPSNFLVNKEGKRFVGEAEPKYVIQRACSQQTDHETFLIMDSSYEDVDVIKEKTEKGYLKQYDTIEELAADNGIDVQALQATIDAYNTAAAAGEPIPADEYSLPADKATIIETAPFYLEKVTLRYFGTIPGIEVNNNCQVLDGDGNVVEGLYASGELVAGNAFTRQYPGVGIGISFAANSGSYAVEHIAQSLK